MPTKPPLSRVTLYSPPIPSLALSLSFSLHPGAAKREVKRRGHLSCAHTPTCFTFTPSYFCFKRSIDELSVILYPCILSPLDLTFISLLGRDSGMDPKVSPCTLLPTLILLFISSTTLHLLTANFTSFSVSQSTRAGRRASDHSIFRSFQTC